MLGRVVAALCTLALGACASVSSPSADPCLESSWLSSATALPRFWKEVRNWSADEFDKRCTASSASAILSPEQRLRLAMAYSAPGNPRRDLDEALKLLADVPGDRQDQIGLLATVHGHIVQEQYRLEEQLRLMDAAWAEARVNAAAEKQRADAEARRAADERKLLAVAEQRARDMERRFIDVSAKHADAARRLEALRAVEVQMSRRARALRAEP